MSGTEWNGRAGCVIESIANTELFLRERNGLLQMIACGKPLGEVLERVTHLVETQDEGALCSVLLFRAGKMALGTAPRLPERLLRVVEGLPIGPGPGPCGEEALTNELAAFCDVAVHPFGEQERDLALELELRGCWSMPIRSADSAVLGRLVIYHRAAGAPEEQHLRLLGIACHIASIAIERDRNEQLLRQRAVELQEAGRRKDVFLAMLAHELKGPLSPIITAAQLARSDVETSQKVGHACDVIERQARHIARLVDDLLDVSGIAEGKTTIHKEEVIVADVVARALEALQPQAQARRQEIVLDLGAQPFSLHADPTRLTQVLYNLIHNAVKYTNPGGRISITARSGGGEVTLSVRDTGNGIDAGALPRIFDLFMQANSSGQRSQGGLGLGLHLVRHLVELHGGRVVAASAGPGQGSEFTVYLPAG